MMKGFDYFSDDFLIAAKLGIDFGFDLELKFNNMYKNQI